MHGLGVFPFVQLPGVEIQVFHCPQYIGQSPSLSYNGGVAARIGGSTVTVLGSQAYANGVLLGSGTTSITSFDISVSGNRVEVTMPSLHGARLVSVKHATSSNGLWRLGSRLVRSVGR